MFSPSIEALTMPEDGLQADDAAATKNGMKVKDAHP